jgi:dihydroorotate dehydrogenase electron transfer subunit
LDARDIIFRVRVNREIASGIYHAVLEPEVDTAPKTKPGQFAMVQVREGTVPLLRRPLSYLRADAKRIEFVYRVVGAGTRMLAGASENDKLRVLGPLGNGFNESMVESRALLVAGGMGIAPVYFLAMFLRARGISNIEVVYGARTSSELLFSSEMKNAGLELRLVTDDGSAGKRAFASEEAADAMRKTVPETVFACGPYPMLQAVAVSAGRIGVPCQISVEERMACGVGACLGCAIKVGEGYQHVCCDGPVFDATDLVMVNKKI